MSSENGPHSNVIKIFRLDRSEAQMFCVSFNNLTVLSGLAVLMEAPYIYFFIQTCLAFMFRSLLWFK